MAASRTYEVVAQQQHNIVRKAQHCSIPSLPFVTGMAHRSSIEPAKNNTARSLLRVESLRNGATSTAVQVAQQQQCTGSPLTPRHPVYKIAMSTPDADIVPGLFRREGFCGS